MQIGDFWLKNLKIFGWSEVEWPDSAIWAMQWSYIFNKYQHWLYYKHSKSPAYVSNPSTKKTTWLNSCLNKLKFLRDC